MQGHAHAMKHEKQTWGKKQAQGRKTLSLYN